MDEVRPDRETPAEEPEPQTQAKDQDSKAKTEKPKRKSKKQDSKGKTKVNWMEVADKELYGMKVYLAQGSFFRDIERSGLELYVISEDKEGREGVSRMQQIGKIPDDVDLTGIRVALANGKLKPYKEGMKIDEPKPQLREGLPRSKAEGRGDFYWDDNGMQISKDRESVAQKLLNKNTPDLLNTIISIYDLSTLEHMLSLEKRGLTDFSAPRSAIVDALEKQLKSGKVGGHIIRKEGEEKVQLV